METGKIYYAPTTDIQPFFQEAKNEIVFCTRLKKYGAIEMQLKSKILTTKWKLFLMFMSRK